MRFGPWNVGDCIGDFPLQKQLGISKIQIRFSGYAGG